MPFRLDGMPRGNDSERQACYFKIVTPDYFSALGMSLRRGRSLSATDAAGRPPVTVVNETFARRFLRGGDAVGRRVFVEQIITGRRELGPEIPWEVVGVVADEKVGSLDSTSAGIYVTYAQSPIVGVSLLVKGSGEPAGFTKVDPERGVGGQPEPGARQRADARGDQVRVGGRHAPADVPARALCRAGAAACGNRHLWGAVLRHGATHAGARRARGARRIGARPDASRRPRRRRPRRCRDPAGTRGFAAG